MGFWGLINLLARKVECELGGVAILTRKSRAPARLLAGP